MSAADDNATAGRDIHKRFAEAAACGSRMRQAHQFDGMDCFDLIERRRSELRKAATFDRLTRLFLRTGRLDRSAWVIGAADLQDDEQPDPLWLLDHAQRRYRIRPWRPSDGEPYGYTFPCLTIIDFKLSRAMVGVPASGLWDLGVRVPLVDSDEHAALWFHHGRRRAA